MKPLRVCSGRSRSRFAYSAVLSPYSGSSPQPFPDFTDGRYLLREPERSWKYCLSSVCDC